MLVENNKSLIKLNTFGVNCYAENFISIKSEEDIEESIDFLNKNQQNHFVLGGGSNILLTPALMASFTTCSLSLSNLEL